MSLFRKIFSKEKKESLDKGLEKTKTSFFDKLSKAVAGKSKVDDDVLDNLEEVLVSSDVGVNTTLKIIDRIEARVAKDKYLGTDELNKILREEIAGLLSEVDSGDASEFELPLNKKPYVIMVVGVKQSMGSDPASVAFDTLKSAVTQNADVVIIDTAGRLHNKVNLMNELTKIKKVMQKVIPDAPHEVLLVLDGSTGQNAFEQAKHFTAATEVTSLAVTKLDGTAKGGVVIGISDQFQIPVKYIGVGEGMEDLQVFNKFEFVDSFFK